jgi:insertion element IS1 protein InsB
MQSGSTRCTQSVDGFQTCGYCKGKCVKNGRISGKQRYLCRCCKRSFVLCYTYPACMNHINDRITQYVKEGCGVRSISRLLKIATSTVLRRIKRLAKSIRKPIMAFGKEYELDELCTYVKRKTAKRWIAYAIRKDTKAVVDFTIGSRTSKTLKRVTDTLVLSEAKKVYTDKLSTYAGLLPKEIHSTRYHGTNQIERMNLNLRTHLKRLSRRTICFSRSRAMLAACLRIYFWG